ncbi:MAG: FG-GAP repeat protein [Phycisphaerales bacterium]
MRGLHIQLAAILTPLAVAASAPGQSFHGEDHLLTSPHAAESRSFGESIDMDGDWLVVGSSDEHPDRRGEVFIYRRAEMPDLWTLHSTLVDDEPRGSEDDFGQAVAIDGDWLAVAASFLAAGDPEVVLFEYDHDLDEWIERQTLQEENYRADRRFGEDLALSEEWLIVGAPDTNGTGVMHFYRRDEVDDEWVLYSQFEAAPGQVEFGQQVAIVGDRAIASAMGEAQYAPGFVRCFRFRPHEDRWVRIQELSPPGAGFRFGSSIDLSDETLVAGDSVEEKAYVFHFDPTWSAGRWELKAVIEPPGGEPMHTFGRAVAIDGNRRLVVTASHFDARETNAGAAFVYRRDRSGDWRFIAPVLSSEPAEDMLFGREVKIADGMLVMSSERLRSGGEQKVLSFALDHLRARFDITPIPMRSNEAATLEMSGLAPNEPVALFASTSLSGSVYLESLGVRLNLASANLLGVKRADERGFVRSTFRVPAAWAGTRWRFQAAQSGVNTNVLDLAIL